jgi:alpha-L-fucosidase
MYILRELAKWNRVCGEGVFGTRPFRVSGEGQSRVVIEGFREDPVAWTSSDFRFTAKGKTIYAFQMKWPENNRSVIKTPEPSEKVRSVRLLGHGPVPFDQPFGTLVVSLPDKKPTEYVNCMALELE